MFSNLKSHRKRFFFCLFLISISLFDLYQDWRYEVLKHYNSTSILIVSSIGAIYIYAKYSGKEH